MADSESKETIPFKQAMANNWYILKLAYEICPKRIIVSLLLSVMWYFSGYYYSIIFTSIVFKAIAGEYEFSMVIILVVINSIVALLMRLVNSWYFNKFTEETNLVYKEKLNLMIFDKTSDVELSCYENADFYNKYTRAGAEANERIVSMVDNMSRFIGLLISSILIIITIAAMNPFALIFIIFPIAFRLLLDTRMNKARFEFNNEKTPFDRAKSYVNRIMYLESYAKDIRVTNIFNLLMKKYNHGVNGTIKSIKKYGKKLAKYRALQDGIERVLGYPLMVIYSALSVLVFNIISASELVVMINAINRLVWSFNDFFGFFTSMQKDGLFIQNFRDFMDYEPKISQSQDGIASDHSNTELELKNLYFSYDGSEQYCLKDINIEIKKGEKIALVGSNGAGKTTLIKLITRLYDPTQGEILFNGENIKKYNVEHYRDMYGTVFQDYKIFSMSVAENIMMRNVTNADEEIVVSALDNSGIYDKIMASENGLDHVLTREFDDNGLMLSGGEFQKLAIARAFAKTCDLVILDEPSSALDPLAEYKVFESMKKVCDNKSVIFISHRLSTAILADRIYMMENGCIVESGSHEELIKLNGQYAEMFARQSQMYLGRMEELA